MLAEIEPDLFIRRWKRIINEDNAPLFVLQSMAMFEGVISLVGLHLIIHLFTLY